MQSKLSDLIAEYKEIKEVREIVFDLRLSVLVDAVDSYDIAAQIMASDEMMIALNQIDWEQETTQRFPPSIPTAEIKEQSIYEIFELL